VLAPLLLLAIVDNRAEYDHVFDIYVPIGVGVFLLFAALIVIFAVRGRRRPLAGVSRRHENNRLEAGYAVLLACVVGFLLYVTFSAEHQIDTVAMREKPAFTIDVVGSKWEWTFYYPATGVERHSGTVGHQSLVVPVNEPIRFDITSRDVIHAFWIPEIGFKRDAIPGAREVVVLAFDQRGRFLGRCAQFCGLRHADMWFPVDVVSASRFRAWVSSRGRTGA
jgi:cytochrome c oxidase subunit 2